MDHEEIERVFSKWWVQSYGSVPGPYARMTHAAFAQWFVEYVKLEEPDPAA